MGDKGINRREFMVRTSVGMATLGLGVVPALAADKELPKTPEIVYRTLGRTGLQLPVVSFGVMNTDSPDLIRKAVDLGIKHLDTAHRYMRGNSETVIGQVLEERKCRDKVYLATKMYFDREKERKVFVGEESGRADPATEKRFDDQLALSLKRLRTDYVDILYLHSCEGPLMPVYEPMMKVFSKVKQAGKARFIGITTHVNEPEVIRAAVDAGIWDVILTSYNFMQHHKEDVKKAIQYAVDKGVGIIAMKTQGGVALNREKPVQVDHGAALKWVLSDRNVCTTIPGITAFEQMDLDFSVMKNLTLSDEEKRGLTIASMSRDPLYCQQCGACISSCNQRVEIPTLMRAYMYAEGYGNLIQAEAAVGELTREPGLNACGNCVACSALCPFGINIGARVNALMAMNLAGERCHPSVMGAHA
jgi:predicted aldo/keto reductase-like oxidoreductase